MKMKVIRAVKDALNDDLQVIREKLPDATMDELFSAYFLEYSSS